MQSTIVVLVDDDAAVRDAVKTHLLANGLGVVDYGSGVDCLAADGAAAGGCLVVDLQMPGMDGLELIAAIRTRGHDTPAIVITSNPDAAAPDRVAALGVHAVVHKPFGGTVLLAAIRSAVRPPPGD